MKNRLKCVLLLLLLLPIWCGLTGFQPGLPMEDNQSPPSRVTWVDNQPAKVEDRNSLTPSQDSPPINPAEAELLKLLPSMDRAKLRWLADEYGWTAVNIVEEHGQKGADVILALGAEGVAVLREQPDTFRKLSKSFSAEASARFLVAMQKHLRELAAQGRLPDFLERLADLSGQSRQLAECYPAMAPFLVLAPEAVTPALGRYPALCLKCFPVLDLSQGPRGLVEMAEDIMQVGERAKGWIECRGLDGLLLAKQFPQFVNRHPPFELELLLASLSSNQEDIKMLIELGREEDVWRAYERLADKARSTPEFPANPDAPSRDGWYSLAIADPHFVRFIVEQDPTLALTEQCLPFMFDGPPVPSLIYDGYRAEQSPQTARNAANALLRAARAGETELRLVYQFLARMARFPDTPAYYHPMSHRVHDLLERLDHRVVFYLLPNLQISDDALNNAIFKLEDRGFDELAEFNDPPSLAVQVLPGYDFCRLVWVLSKGYQPTFGEVVFAGVDVAFTAWDIAGLGKSLAKAAGKGMLKEGLKNLAKEGAETFGEKAARAIEKGGKELVALSPKAIRAAEKDAVSWLTYWAERSARHRGIALTAIKTGAKAYAREWTLGYAIGMSLQELADVAMRTDNTFWAEKTLEVLRYLEKPVN